MMISTAGIMHKMMRVGGAGGARRRTAASASASAAAVLLHNNNNRAATAAAAAGWSNNVLGSRQHEVTSTTITTTKYCWKSTTTTTTTTAGSSPSMDDTSTQDENQEQHPKLVVIPSLPLVGSFITSYSGIPVKTEQNTFDFWPEMKQRFGSFYQMGWPGVGKGLKGITYIIQDPHEMSKILRREGKFPRGSAEFSWAMTKSLQDQNVAASALLSHGPEWKRIRTFLQKDLLSPMSAKQYLPAIIDAAKSCSKGAAYYCSKSPNEFVGLASFEMFSNAMLGSKPNACCDPLIEAQNPRDKLFVDTVLDALRVNQQLTISPWDAFAVLKLGIETTKYKDFNKLWEQVLHIAREKVDVLKEKRDSGNDLSSMEQSCYANQAFERALEEDSEVTVEEAATIASGLLAAAVDTTGGLLSWKMMFLACHPNVQDTIYDEIMNKHDGQITTDSMSPKASPYLYAFIRECHRLRAPVTTVPMKFLDNDVTVHGITLTKGSVVVLDGYSTGVDSEFVHNPQEFQPERFLPDAVAARKGTESEIIDHPMFSGPFSQGARKCPGSRVANYETAVLMAQLVKDWKFNFVDEKQHWSDIPYDLDTVTTAKLPPMEFVSRK